MRSNLAKIFTCFMLVIFFLNTNYVMLYYGVFKLNQSDLAATVCEKKKEGCNACCYLNKKIEQESDESKATAENVNIKLKLSEFTVYYFYLPETSNSTSIQFTDKSLNPSEGFYSLPGKPPQFA
ncbi:MAG: hypothetical protein JST55_07335 [Bacteroidetes bacterium]|nr:hypothetical protein [Bacteroidota bacterium]